jgi:hypothetical protein
MLNDLLIPRPGVGIPSPSQIAGYGELKVTTLSKKVEYSRLFRGPLNGYMTGVSKKFAMDVPAALSQPAVETTHRKRALFSWASLPSGQRYAVTLI